ncbi:hypothetical protein SBF1_2420004 [Candidatus Desulfosporosinus infrequens]|uniref:Uncharacterized protein n=1 Tax=Candidatus Desulfosporosinus infrequens TaxID=2043169 RepID=A0A2U3KN89_9FIRM|nr:hypothetical protein SBF1_2420004 [Candidatus Desulfosporosinus infrequens]
MGSMKNIYLGLETIEDELTIEQIDERLQELQREIMSNVTMEFDDKEYSTLVTEIKRMQERRQGTSLCQANAGLAISRMVLVQAHDLSENLIRLVRQPSRAGPTSLYKHVKQFQKGMPTIWVVSEDPSKLR